jgi:hypothetical protein
VNDELWSPEPLFKDKTVFVLASGPSLTQESADRVRGRLSIVINSSCMIAPFADVLFFTDNSWFEPRKDIVANWPGMVVTMSRHAKRDMPDKIKRIAEQMRPDFPPLGSDHIRAGRTSGHRAVSLAVAMGAATIVLLGFDMRMVNGKEHHHTEYTEPRDLDQYAHDFVPAFNGWKADALKVGVEILNATPLSAVHEFSMVSLDEALLC